MAESSVSETDTEPATESSGISVRSLIITLLLLVVGFGAYFFLYIEHRGAEISEHKLRLLGSAGEYVFDTVNGLVGNVATALSNRETNRKNKNPDVQTIKDRLASISVLDVGSVEKWTPPTRKDSVTVDSLVVSDVTMKVETFLDEASGNPRLRLTAWRKDMETRAASGRVDLDVLLGRALPAEFFDEVLLARSNGDVLFQVGESEVRLRHLEPPAPPTPLFKDKDAARPVPPVRVPTSQAYDLQIAGERYKVFVQPIPLPVAVNVAQGGPDGYWLAVGLIKAARFRALTMAISPIVVFMVIALIAIGLLSLPMLKIRFMGPRENLRYVDVLVVVFAILVAVSLATFSAAFYVLHEQLAERTEASLEELSLSIQTHLRRELGALDAMVVTMTKVHGSDSTASRKNLLTDTLLTTRIAAATDSIGFPQFELAFWLDDKGTQTARWSIRGNSTFMLNLRDRQYYAQPHRGLVWDEGAADSTFLQGRFVESIRSKTTGRESAVLARLLKRPPATDNAVAAVESRLMSVIAPVLPPGYGFAVVDANGMVQFHSERIRNVREDLFRELGESGPTRDAIVSRRSALTRTTYRTNPSVLCVTAIPQTPWSLVVMADAQPSREWLISIIVCALGLFGLYFAVLVGVSAILRGLRAPPRAGERRRLHYWPHLAKQRVYARLLPVLIGAVVLSLIVIAAGNTRAALLTAFIAPIVVMILFEIAMRSSGHPAPDPGADPRPSAGLFAWAWRMPTLYKANLALLLAMSAIVPSIGILRAVIGEGNVQRIEREQLTFARAIRDRAADQADWYQNVKIKPRADSIVTANVLGIGNPAHRLGFYTPSGWSWEYELTRDTSRRWEPVQTPTLDALGRAMARIGVPTAWARTSLPPTDLSSEWYRDSTGTVMCELQEPVASTWIGDLDGGSRTTRFGKLRIESASPPLGSTARVTLVLLGLAGLLVLIGISEMLFRWVTLGDVVGPAVLDGRLLLDLGLGDDKTGTTSESNAPGTDTIEAVPSETGTSKAPVPVSEESGLGSVRRVLLLRLKLGKKTRAKFHTIGIDQIRSETSVADLIGKVRDHGEKQKALNKPCFVLLTQFDYGLRDSRIVRRKLALMESIDALPRDYDVRVFIESSIEPLYFLTSRFQERYFTRRSLGIEVDRWAESLQHFVRIRRTPGVTGSFAPSNLPEEVRAALLDEGSPNGLLWGITDRLNKDDRLKTFDRDQVVDVVLDMAMAHYRRVWSTCSTAEKLLLYRVAREGVVNRNAIQVLRPLLRRGLVLKDPNVRIMNESFRRFILTAEKDDVIAKWERRGGVSSWARMRGPIFGAIMVLGIFFFATQREAFNQSLALMATLAASGPGLISLMGGLGQLRHGTAKKD